MSSGGQQDMCPSLVLPAAARHAATTIHARPATSVDSLSHDLQNDTALHTAFNQHFQLAIRERIEQDDNYIGQKYPNTEKQFNQK